MRVEINLKTEEEEKKVFEIVRDFLIDQFQEFDFRIEGTTFSYKHFKQKI